MFEEQFRNLKKKVRNYGDKGMNELRRRIKIGENLLKHKKERLGQVKPKFGIKLFN